MFKKIENHVAGMTLVVVAYLAGTITLLVNKNYLTNLSEIIFISGLAAVLFMSALFLLSRILKRTDIIDAAWGPVFIVIAITSFITGGQVLGNNTQSLILLLIGIWGIRLSYAITRRLLTHDEDKRYVELRREWKNVNLNTYVRIFILQAILATLVSIAVIYINSSDRLSSNNIWIYIGCVVWIVGFIFETIGDIQLKSFLANKKNRGKLMTQGLWAYTRHPNYFGESAMWWGIFIVTLSAPYGVIGIITPIIITYLLYFVSGVPMTEKSFEGKPGWSTYKKQTSKFIPLPRKL